MHADQAQPHRHGHGHAHSHAQAPRLRASWLRLSSSRRLAGVGVLLTLLWLAVFWALS